VIASVGRRDLLRRAGLLVGALAGGAVLARCAPGPRSAGPAVATPMPGATAASPAGPRTIERLTLS